MIKRNNKKGFTIVELVIVIAVIAILAAVLIPTFSGIIKKANESADLQAVRQMNTILAVEDAYKGGLTINDAVAALNEAGLNGEDYIALVSGRYFFYDQNENRIVYTEYKDGEYVALYPDDIDTTGHTLLSLSGDVAKKDYAAPSISGNTATFSIGTAEEYAQLAADFKAIMNGESVDALADFKVTKCASSSYIMGVADKNIVIELTSDVDFKGSSFNLNLTNCTFTLKGNGHTISGVVNNSGFAVSSGNSENKAYEYGGAFLGYVSDSTVVFDSVTFKNCHFGNEDVKASAIFVGQFNGNSSLTLKNTSVVDCTVGGLKGVAVYLGHACGNGSQTVAFEGTNTVSGCDLTATDTKNTGLVGTIIGRISGDNKVVKGAAPTFTDLTITSAGKAVENAASRSIINQQNAVADTDVVAYTGTEWTK